MMDPVRYEAAKQNEERAWGWVRYWEDKVAYAQTTKGQDKAMRELYVATRRAQECSYKRKQESVAPYYGEVTCLPPEGLRD